MTREEMWKEFEKQLVRETRTPITVSYDVSEKMTKSAIERTVAKWKERLEQEPCEDATSRKELLKIYEDRFCELQKLKHLKDNKGAEDRQMGVNYCINVLKELPPVTPQEQKKGHWELVQRGKEVDICCSKCEAARIKGYAYNYTIDQLKEDMKEYFKNDDMRYCPYCGSDNSEVEQ